MSRLKMAFISSAMAAIHAAGAFLPPAVRSEAKSQAEFKQRPRHRRRRASGYLIRTINEAMKRAPAGPIAIKNPRRFRHSSRTT